MLAELYSLKYFVCLAIEITRMVEMTVILQTSIDSSVIRVVLLISERHIICINFVCAYRCT